MHFIFADALTSREKNDKVGWKRVCHKVYIKGVRSNQLITACRVCRVQGEAGGATVQSTSKYYF